MKALAGTFNQEKALVAAFSVITNLHMELFEALSSTGQLEAGLLGVHCGSSTADDVVVHGVMVSI